MVTLNQKQIATKTLLQCLQLAAGVTLETLCKNWSGVSWYLFTERLLWQSPPVLWTER